VALVTPAIDKLEYAGQAFCFLAPGIALAHVNIDNKVGIEKKPFQGHYC